MYQSGVSIATMLTLSLIARLPVTMLSIGLLVHAQRLTGSFALAGLVTGAYALALGAGGPLLARLVDRRGQTSVLLVSATVSAALLLVLALLPVGAPFAKAPPIPARRYGPALADDVMPEFTDPRAPRNPIPGLGIQPPATDQPAVRLEAGLREAEWDEPEPPDDAPPRAVDELERLQTRFGYDGRFLRGVREHRGLTIESVSEATKISVRYLRAIEENAYDSLPASTFVRGYIREFARVLTLPSPDAAVDGFMALFSHHRG